MTANNQIPIFYINMDDTADRRSWFEAQAARLGLDVNRVTAVAGRELPGETLDRLKASIQSGTPLGPSEIGCFLSHREGWQQVVASGAPWAFVAEDDLHLANSAAIYFRSTNWIPEDADIVKPETTFRKCHLGSDALPSPDGRAVRRLLSLHGGAGGYFLSRTAATEALAVTETLCEPADHILFNPEFRFFSDHIVYQIDPAFAVQDLLRRENKAGFEQSGLATERKRMSNDKTHEKIAREFVRPFRQFLNYTRNVFAAKSKSTIFKSIPYELGDSQSRNDDLAPVR